MLLPAALFALRLFRCYFHFRALIFAIIAFIAVTRLLAIFAAAFIR